MHAVQLYRPDGMMGGSQLVFQRDDQIPLMLGSSDEGDIFFFDWTQKATEESPKIEYVTKIWQYERSYRPCIGLELSPIPGFEDIFLSIHDYHFCIWKADCDVPIFSSSILENAHITSGCFSPTRPGVIIIGRSDGYLDFWDLTDQSHTYIMHHLVVSVGISTLYFNKEMPNILVQ
jgi:dynein intermediate chain 3, axonemal